MSRATNAPASRARRKKRVKMAKGYFGRRKLFRNATETVNRALRFAYAHRKRKKSDFRKLWILRIGTAAKNLGFSYSKLMAGLTRGKVKLDRKVLSNIAVYEAGVFEQIVKFAKEQLS